MRLGKTALPLCSDAIAVYGARLPHQLRFAGVLATVFALGFLVATPFSARPACAEEVKRKITQIVIKGNSSITEQQIRAKLLSKVGQELDERRVDVDLKTLHATKWFKDVHVDDPPDPAVPGGIMLVFVVEELPILTSVEFQGAKKVKVKDLEEATGLKKGARADATLAKAAVGKISRLYAEKGYGLAEVEIVSGQKPTDRKVVFRIFEGPVLKVGKIEFFGNTEIPDSTLRTKITSRTPILGLIGGNYQVDNLVEDRKKLIEYYEGLGFFNVEVSPVTRTGASLGDIRIEFDIKEGPRYKVREVVIEGNEKLAAKDLRDGLLVKKGAPYQLTLVEADKKRLLAKYYALGCIKAEVAADYRATEEPGVVDQLYKINEGPAFLMAELKIKGNDHTLDKVIRREANMAGLLPGKVLDKNRFDMFQKRLNQLGYFSGAPGDPNHKPIEITIINERDGSKPYGDGILPSFDAGVTLTGTRGQDPGPGTEVVVPPLTGSRARRNSTRPNRLQLGQDLPPASSPAPVASNLDGASGSAASPVEDSSSASPRARLAQQDDPSLPSIDVTPPPSGGGTFSPPPDTVPDVGTPDGGGLPPALPNGGGLPPLPPGGVTNPRLNPIGTGEPPGGFPNVPGMNVNDVGPDRNDPFRNRSFADVLTSVEESPTGNFSLAFGASSFQGLYGMLTVAEKNFNIWNPPRTWDDILQGKSFRGGGQQLILTLMPGTVLNSAQLKFVEPYLFEQPITFSTTGYFNYRFYPNWTLSRGGTQIALGRLLSPTLFADVGMSAENVNFFGYRYPAPADYLAATGNTSLFSLRPSIRYDTRNSPFMASRGRYLQLAFQQGWGSFTFPKVEVEGRSYWTLFSRPDGSGPRVLEVRGFLGAAGRATPVYERFFAGNFGSLRGFQYYGVGPFQFGSNAGGIFEALGSVEYRFPLNARDTIYQVAFCDFGTVEQNYDFHNMRVSVGTGLRITLPFMPMPIAVDLAFPVSSAQGDVKQFFNFSVGATY